MRIVSEACFCGAAVSVCCCELLAAVAADEETVCCAPEEADVSGLDELSAQAVSRTAAAITTSDLFIF
jgi:hypothetical protein